ncbi:MAG: RluA family pseudouridine synthase [Flavobacteriales bacterium]|nr:RluA family pseudouridine synthase [Flavobacteriales bacterium]MCB9198307.1 RluA family pseudouridine synthase [Flavobacteriales bacterium]
MSKIEVLYEDNHLIAVCKKASDIVQGDKTEDKPLVEEVKEYVKQKYNKPGEVFLGVIHRLDRPVGGVVIFARTSKALVRMNAMFQDKTVQKTYWAIVEQSLPEEEGTLIHYLKKNQEKNKSRAYDEPVKESKISELDYRLLGRTKNYHFVEVKPKTGRHHQIRVQLSHIGCPIKGDVKYGGKRTNRDGSINLFGRSITFFHPVTKEEITIVANPPKEDPLWKEVVQLSKI